MASRHKQVDDTNLPAVADFGGAVGTFGDGAVGGDWVDKLKAHADKQKAVQTSDSGWPWFSIKGGVVKFDGEIRESTFAAVILGACFDYRLYKGGYDPNTASNPECFSIGMTEDGTPLETTELHPPADLETLESELCKSCWANAFDSARMIGKDGKGKACNQRVRLALLSAENGINAEKLENDGARFLIPPTSVSGRVPEHNLPGIWKNWNSYVSFLNKMDVPTWAVVTSIHVMPDPNVQVRVMFQPVGPIQDPAALEVLERRVADSIMHLRQEPQRDAGSDDQQAANKKRTRTVRRGAGKKKTTTSATPKANKASEGGKRKF